MRSWIAPVLLVLTLASPAAAESLSEAELRLGYGVALSGSGQMTSAQATPLTIAATGSVAIRDQPPLSVFGGIVLETLDRTSAGATGGVRLTAGPLRLSGGGTAVLAPSTLWGVTASGGLCRHVVQRMELCGDVQLTSFIAGGDLADGHTVTQVQAVLGVVIDVF